MSPNWNSCAQALDYRATVSSLPALLPPWRSDWRAALGLAIGLVWLSASGAAGCSWLVDGSVTQCRGDADCARFGAVCDLATQVCVPRSSDGATPPRICQFADSCRPCGAGQAPGLANACGDAGCVSFDPARVTRTGPDGGLRPLPAVLP